MLLFHSIQLLNSPFLSKFSIQRDKLSPTLTYHKPFSNIFFPSLISSMDPLSDRTDSTSTADSSQEELPVSQPASPGSPNLPSQFLSRPRRPISPLNESVISGFIPNSSPGQLLSEDYSQVSSVDEIAKGIVHLECESSAEGGVCHVYLVGTVHLSQESCKEMKAVISYLKPQVVFLELCPSRVHMLTLQNIKVPTTSEMFEMWKNQKANPFGILYSWIVAKVASKLEVLPGAEFRVAYEEAMRYGARVILGDRLSEITLRRTWGNMPTWHKIKFLFYIVFLSVFFPSAGEIAKMLKEMDDVDALTVVVQKMSKAFPSLVETLIVERDKYMSQRLLKVARENSSVVAVVGRGHLSGIKKNWMQPVEVQSLLEVPSTRKGFGVFMIFASVGVITGAAVASGIYLWSKKYYIPLRS